MSQLRFQFTHPGRGATSRRSPRKPYKRGFNSRTPGGVRRLRPRHPPVRRGVSIHAPREGCDRFRIVPSPTLSKFQFTHPGRGATYEYLKLYLTPEFQFTHPGRGATLGGGQRGVRPVVSIHAPREGCDACGYTWPYHHSAFQFTHPGRGATHLQMFDPYPTKFQFTHPGRGATTCFGHLCRTDVVSIHAPREGCDAVHRAVS